MSLKVSSERNCSFLAGSIPSGVFPRSVCGDKQSVATVTRGLETSGGVVGVSWDVMREANYESMGGVSFAALIVLVVL